MPPTYRERLRLEGAVLTASAALAAVVLLAGAGEASDNASSTITQLAAVALLLAVFGTRSARRSVAAARPAQPGEELSGAPTALWKPPLVVLALIALVVVPGELGLRGGGWDAGLRIAGGCVLVGLAQMLLFERVVAASEARSGRTYVRAPGRGLTSGTKLAYFGSERV